MKLILSEQCESLTGSLGRGFGYFIQARRTKSGKVNYFSQRSKYGAPPDGHWRFIVACAKLAQKHLHISDIAVSKDELVKAITEAGYMYNPAQLSKPAYNAADVLHFQQIFGL